MLARVIDVSAAYGITLTAGEIQRISSLQEAFVSSAALQAELNAAVRAQSNASEVNAPEGLDAGRTDTDRAVLSIARLSIARFEVQDRIVDEALLIAANLGSDAGRAALAIDLTLSAGQPFDVARNRLLSGILLADILQLGACSATLCANLFLEVPGTLAEVLRMADFNSPHIAPLHHAIRQVEGFLAVDAPQREELAFMRLALNGTLCSDAPTCIPEAHNREVRGTEGQGSAAVRARSGVAVPRSGLDERVFRREWN